jgi:hypothetical protein
VVDVLAQHVEHRGDRTRAPAVGLLVGVLHLFAML